MSKGILQVFKEAIEQTNKMRNIDEEEEDDYDELDDEQEQ
jgi:hypothetical protein